MHLLPNPPSDEPSILLVDDQRSARVTLRRQLRARGLPVLEAGNVATAIGFLENHAISVIVADWILEEERDGISLLDEVAARWPNAERLLWSGHFDAELVLAAHRFKHNVVSKSDPTLMVVDAVVRRHAKYLTRKDKP